MEREPLTYLSSCFEIGRFDDREQERKLKYIMYVERIHTRLRS